MPSFTAKKGKCSQALILWALGLCAASVVFAQAHVSSAGTRPLSPGLHRDSRQASFDASVNQKLADRLGWVSDPHRNGVCKGYYREPNIIVQSRPPASYKEGTVRITASQSVILSKTGQTQLIGHVVVSQPGRELRADKALINRSPKTGKITTLELYGHVRVRESGRLLLADSVHASLSGYQRQVNHVVFRLARSTPLTHYNLWGTALTAKQTSPDVLVLHQAQFSTCPPTHCAWRFRTQTFKLNKHTKHAKAYNNWVYFYRLPVLYAPYLSFSWDKSRKTGFLMPILDYNPYGSGFDIAFPFYFNLAPNYDALLLPRYLSRRGVMWQGVVRYLTPRSGGSVAGAVIAHDRAFAQFRKMAPQVFSASDSYTQRALSRLARDKNTRAYVHWDNDTQLNEHWSSSMHLNYVTDDYYFMDFGRNPREYFRDQLLNQANVHFNSLHWHMLLRFQGFQTLFPVNQSPVLGQYQRLPQFTLLADYPNQRFGVHYQFTTEFVQFDHEPDFVTGQPVTAGSRFKLVPSIMVPFLTEYGYMTPRLQLHVTHYQLKDQVSGEPDEITRFLPIVDLDAGLFFERDVHWLGHEYRQTLEPRLFYLYVPFAHQEDIPLFDTTLLPFGYDRLFLTNRFSGVDRIGDANQLTLGLTSRLLDGFTGEELYHVSLGEIFYFTKRRVCEFSDCSDEPDRNDAVSSLVGDMAYHLNHDWSVVASMSWNPNHSLVNNAEFGFHYQPIPRHLLYIGYTFVRDGNQIVQGNSEHNHLNRINIGMNWLISRHVNVVGQYNYNISHRRTQNYIYGLEYDHCCWAFRVLASRTLVAEKNLLMARYETRYYIQIKLTGLGSLGSRNPSDLLQANIPGYDDIFHRH